LKSDLFCSVNLVPYYNTTLKHKDVITSRLTETLVPMAYSFSMSYWHWWQWLRGLRQWSCLLGC